MYSKLNIPKKKIVEKCIGCTKVQEDDFCFSYYSPETIWRIGNCPLATYISKSSDQEQQKIRVGQQKQKKKKSRK